MVDTGHNIKWDRFEILESRKTNKHCFIKESLLIKKYRPSLSGTIASETLSSLFFLFSSVFGF